MLSRSLGKGTSFTGQQTTVLGIGVAFMAFTSVVIALRVYVRTLLLRAWGADDGEPTIVPRSFDKSNEHAVLMVIGTVSQIVPFRCSVKLLTSGSDTYIRSFYRLNCG